MTTDFQSLDSDADLGQTIEQTLLSRKPAGRPDPDLLAIPYLAGQMGTPLNTGVLGRIPVPHQMRWTHWTVDVWPETAFIALAVRHAPFPVGGARAFDDALDGDEIGVSVNGVARGRALKGYTRHWFRMDMLEIEATDLLDAEQVLVTFYGPTTPRAGFNRTQPSVDGQLTDDNGYIIVDDDHVPVVEG